MVYSNGSLIIRDKIVGSVGKVGSLRGVVSGFSLASRRRLRRWLLTKCLFNCSLYGVTLTVPASGVSDSCERFRRCWHRFRMALIRCFPKCGFVWRVELQINRTPHLHLVCYHDSPVSSSDYLGLWYKSILPDFEVPSLSAFARHGALVQPLDGSIHAFRYLCDHGSKAKQAQLGWLGRQWGIIGKSRFSDRLGSLFDVPDSLEFPLMRFLGRLCRFRVKSDCVFGSKLSRGRKRFSVCYVSEYTIRRWLKSQGVDLNVYDTPLGKS